VQNPAARNRLSLPQLDIRSHTGHGKRLLRAEKRNGKFVALPKHGSSFLQQQAAFKCTARHGQRTGVYLPHDVTPPPTLGARQEANRDNSVESHGHALKILSGSRFP